MFIEVHQFLLSSKAYEDDEQRIIMEVIDMADVKELKDEVYGRLNFDELTREILKEIIFYASGFGWTTASDDVEEVHILFPYVEKAQEESSKGYIDSLKILIRAQIRYCRCVAKTFNPIKDFSWSLKVSDNKDFLVLTMFKM